MVLVVRPRRPCGQVGQGHQRHTECPPMLSGGTEWDKDDNQRQTWTLHKALLLAGRRRGSVTLTESLMGQGAT